MARRGPRGAVARVVAPAAPHGHQQLDPGHQQVDDAAEEAWLRPGRTGLAIGLDFGTASARTLLLDLSSGEELAVSEQAYADGVIDTVLPGTGERLAPDWPCKIPAITWRCWMRGSRMS